MKYIFLTCILTLSIHAHIAAQTVADHEHHYLTALLENSIRFDTSYFAGNSDEIINEEEAWKQWETVENFTYGKDRGSIPMIADLNALHPYFRDKISELIRLCKEQGIELVVVETFRTHAKQAEYFGMGRKYTRSKGGKSKHQYGLAADVVPVVNSVAVWDNALLWRKIGAIGERIGLRWGGRWKAPYDPAHFEWSGGVTSYQLALGAQPIIPKSKISLYPCLDEELARLEKFWNAWETEQAVSARRVTPKSKSTQSAVGQQP